VRIIKTKPRMTLRAPALVTPGEAFEVELQVDCRRPVAIEGLTAVLHESWWGMPIHKGAPPSMDLEEGSVALSGPATLEAGTRTYRASFRLPASAFASFNGRYARGLHFIKVRAAIPWWPDPKIAFELKVAPPRPPAPPPSRPVALSTAPDGPRADEPYVELSLATDSAEPGDVLRGAIALGNVEHVRYKRVELSLVGRERFTCPDCQWQGLNVGYSWKFATRTVDEEGALGREMRFEVPIPAAVQPSCEGPVWRWEWWIEARAITQWKRDVALSAPLTILPRGWVRPGGGAAAAGIAAPPTIGSDRVHAVWESVAAATGLALDERDRLIGRRADADVVVRREHCGSAGVYLVGEIAVASLGLGLDVRPAGRLARMTAGWGGHLVIGDPDFERRHHIEGREEAQVAAFLDDALRARLDAFGDFRLEDAAVRVQQRDAGLNPKKLVEFVRAVLDVADAIPAARARVPAPAAMAEGLGGWRELAARLGAPLETTCMAVRGHLHGRAADVVTEWEHAEEPARTRITLAAEPALDAAYALAVTVTPEAPPALDALPIGRWPAEARAVLAPLLEGAESLEVASERTVVVLPRGLVDPAPALDRLDLMARLQLALRVTQGPYR
jgi:hypothetical protein